jgi:hypothetical protein
MCTDSHGNPFIASYWRPKNSKIPQYHLVYHDGSKWRISQISKRKSSFELGGGGTKRIPISRPQLIINSIGIKDELYMIFRDSERGNHVSVASCEDLRNGSWNIKDLTTESVDMWEPSYDAVMWNQSKILHLFLMKVSQGDREKTENITPQMVSILEWKPE